MESAKHCLLREILGLEKGKDYLEWIKLNYHRYEGECLRDADYEIKTFSKYPAQIDID